ncbi:phosphodiester glycosidase family protein [Planomonospora venezuelensis]|uniref:Exopolysaccharide biosynthesis protein n=1 Tax=Planomonospora venezuelensis TaxID=1999 RepID=A0A841D4K1_PLAVE|nr:phosphodiester glycosidase family protein [Planomonospora venezuelensis]MBB5965572.1 exopolysaccharide biosynthesis protein [Planomonospora venezuelensis]GIM62717.1 lipoprotein [Planomonospora venezuelensis]
MSRRLIVGLSAVALTVTAIPAEAQRASLPFPGSAFPLGERVAPTKNQRTVAPGVDLFSVMHGKSTQGWTVSVLMPNGHDSGTLATAQAKAEAVEAAGFTPSVLKIVQPAAADAPAVERYMVRVGLWTFKQRAKADKVVKELKEFDIRAKTDYLGDDGDQTTGPWDMRVVMVDPKVFRGSYKTSVGSSVAKRETTGSMSKRVNAIAGVNGGFFNIHTARALQGDPVGISVVGGKLLSEAVPGRSGLVITGRKARITELKTTVTAISSDGAKIEVNGVNRAAGAEEIVLYTEEFGAKTAADGGAEVVVDAQGKIVKARAAGGAVPRGHYVLHATGTMADWLHEHAWATWTMKLDTKVIDLRTRKAVPLTPETYVMGGGVGLVRNGRVRITAAADGHASVNMMLRRHPRTMVGVSKSGGLILVTVDGRNPGVSVGASMVEAAQIMRWLGAKQAINFDGGGSSAMVVGHKVINRPSDGRERTVGDALFITP